LRLGGLSYQSGTENRYRYNGKELHQEFNLGLYDYGARMYDPSIGRWNGVDLLAELYDGWSPYNYALNSPINYIDVYGLFVSDSLVNTNRTIDGDPLYQYDEEVVITAYSSDQETVSENEPDEEKPEGVTTQQAAAYSLGTIGSGLGTIENFVVDPNTYRPTAGPNKGKSTPTFKTTSTGRVITNKNSAFKVKINGQVYRVVPRSAVALEKMKLASSLKTGGRILGVGGLFLTGADIYENGLTISNALDLGFGVVGFLGPVGFVVSTAYFAANLATEYYTGKNIGTHLEEFVTEQFD